MEFDAIAKGQQVWVWIYLGEWELREATVKGKRGRLVTVTLETSYRGRTWTNEWKLPARELYPTKEALLEGLEQEQLRIIERANEQLAEIRRMKETSE